MKPKDHKAFQAWCLPYLTKLRKILLLHDFYPINFQHGVQNSDAHADCHFHYPYKTITIGYSDALIKDWKAKKYSAVIGVLTHEMCHPITDPLYAKAASTWRTKGEVEDERERLTDHIANIILDNKLI